MDINQDVNNYDDFIGATVRASNWMSLGKVVSIDQYEDGYGHNVSFVITDKGSRFNCRRFFNDLSITR